jgi:hypothetical protein
MNLLSISKRMLHHHPIYPQSWLNGLISYPRYLGYVKPRLMTRSEEEYWAWRQPFVRAWTPRKFVAPVGESVAALSPHPYDESMGAGGLLRAIHKQASEQDVAAVEAQQDGELSRS